MHTLPGVKEKFVNDLKEAVKLIMTQDDRQLGPKVCLLILYSRLSILHILVYGGIIAYRPRAISCR